jgi:hypothetical protein
MCEREFVSIVSLRDGPCVHCYLNHGVDGLLIEAGDRSCNIDREVRSDHCCDLEGGYGVFAEMVEPASNDFTHSFRDAVVADGGIGDPPALGIDSTLVLEMGCDLLYEERVALGLFCDRFDNVRCRGGAEVARDHLLDFFIGEPLKRGPYDPVPSAKIGEESRERMAPHQVGVAVCADKESGELVSADEMGEHGDRVFVRPVEIVEHHHRRRLPVLRLEQSRERLSHQVPGRVGIGLNRNRDALRCFDAGHELSDIARSRTDLQQQLRTCSEYGTSDLDERLVRKSGIGGAPARNHGRSTIGSRAAPGRSQ